MWRVFVVPKPDRKIPEGVAGRCPACGEQTEASGQGTRDARAVMQGAAFGFIFKLLISFVGLLKGTLEGALVLGQRIFYLGGDISVALLGVGLIVQLNIAALVFLGGALGWLVALPLLGLRELL